jgi:hypothetical protein
MVDASQLYYSPLIYHLQDLGMNGLVFLLLIGNTSKSLTFRELLKAKEGAQIQK